MTTSTQTSTKPASPFISASALRQRLKQGGPISLIFVTDDGSTPEHLIPGSRITKLATHFAGTSAPGKGRLPLPQIEDVRQWLREANVAPDTNVVVYDTRSGTQAARAWWVLGWAGWHDVQILDGGLAAWHAETEEENTPRLEPTNAAKAGPAYLSVDTADLEQALESYRLIDARGKQAFEGDGTQPAHLPGAINSPAAQWQDASGKLLPREERQQKAAALGLLQPQTQAVVAYCGSGVAAAYWIAATVDLGVEAALYAGSWSAWSTRPQN